MDDTALQALGKAPDVVRQCSEALIHVSRRMQGQVRQPTQARSADCCQCPGKMSSISNLSLPVAI
eukprot:2386551-Pyramimonas_sp.AAC.1